MESSFEILPIELVEAVLTYLELNDVVNLRSLSHNLKIKTSTKLIPFFKHKTVELTVDNLEEMIWATSPGRLGRYLQHCTVFTSARLGKMKSKEEEQEHSRLLYEAFSNIRSHSPDGCIASLSLSVAVVPVESKAITYEHEFCAFEEVWDAAAFTFRVAMTALAQSGLIVHEHLNVFGSINGCSLGSDIFQSLVLDLVTSRKTFRSLKKLTLSCSAPVSALSKERESRTIESEENHISHSNTMLHDVLRLKRIMPDLQSLDVHWYGLSFGIATPATLPPTPRPKSDSVELLANVHLRDCTLRGIHTSPELLVQFLEAVNCTALLLINTRIRHVHTYDDVFRYLTSPVSPVRMYHLNDLLEGHGLLQYEDTLGSMLDKIRNQYTRSCKMTRSADQSKEPIRYRIAGSHSRHIVYRDRYQKAKAREYGWPHEFGYNFVQLNKPLTRARREHLNCFTDPQSVFGIGP